MSPRRVRTATTEAKPEAQLGDRTDRSGSFTARGDWDFSGDWNDPRRKFVQHLVDLRRRTIDPLSPADIVAVILNPINREFRGLFNPEAIADWSSLEAFDDWQLVVPVGYAENAATASVRFCGNSGLGQEHDCRWFRGWYKPARLLGGRYDQRADPAELHALVRQVVGEWIEQDRVERSEVVESQSVTHSGGVT